MRHGRRVALVVPAFEAGVRLGPVLDGVPAWVDRVVVVDDGSARPVGVPDDGRVTVVRHARNRGVGAAIVTGYREAHRLGAEVAVVWAADGQMDPADLPALADAVLLDGAAYAKGDRLSHPQCDAVMPRWRHAGNCCLTFLTRFTAGVPGLRDAQCGYTALRLDALPHLPLDWLYPRYGFPNDLLAAVSGAGLPVAQVTVAPVYRGEPSGIRPVVAALFYPLVLARGPALRWLAWRRSARLQRLTVARPLAAGGTRCASSS
jgi:glycosyltransferase involved in cell wall biosynthesis